jgi:anti-sigma B factor antagonist
MTVEAVGEPGPAVPRVLRAAGDLDVATVPRLLLEVPALIADAVGVVLDLTDVTFLDSSGVRLVDRFGHACARTNTPFRVVAPPGHRARRILDIVGFRPPLVADDLPTGLAAVQAASQTGQ